MGRLIGLLTLFSGAMLGVVLADNLLLLYGFWEGRSVTSFLLIGDQYRLPAARSAALQAILVTGAGGLAMLFGFVILGHAGRHLPLERDPRRPPCRRRRDRGARADRRRRLHQVGPVPVPRLAARGDGRPDPRQRLPPLGHHGEGGGVPHRPPGARLRRVGDWMAAPRRRGGPPVDGRRRAQGAAPARPQAPPRLRHHQPARLHGRALRRGARSGHPRGPRGESRPRLVQGHPLHDRGRGRPRHRHARHRRLPPLGPEWRSTRVAAVVAAASMAGVPLTFGFVAKELGLEFFLDGGVEGSGLVLAVIVLGPRSTAAYAARSASVACTDASATGPTRPCRPSRSPPSPPCRSPPPMPRDGPSSPRRSHSRPSP